MRASQIHVMRDICFFFFSSRRRHTRCSRDWSSDVCSSDLEIGPASFAPTNAPMSSPAAMIAAYPKFTCPRRLYSSTPRIPTGRSSAASDVRSEEHTSELQSRLHLVCRLLLEKKKNKQTNNNNSVNNVK